MGAIKDYVNQGFAVGDITVSTYDETGARIRIKDFYDLDLIERQRVVNFAGKVDVELLNIENKITVETDGKFSEYYKSSEIDTKFYNKSETDGKLSGYPTKSEVSSDYVPKTLEAQESIKGITNFKDMKKQVNYLSGAEYKDNNEFGSDLKNITEGQMYYYGNKPYMAIKTASNTTGFLVPDSTNFIDISNKSLNNSRNLHEQMIFGNEMWRAMLINTNTPYAAPAGYKLKSISAIHPGTVTSIVFSVNTAAGNQQYQLNSNYPATVACMVIVVFEKI